MSPQLDFEQLTSALRNSKQVVIYGADHMALMTLFELSLFGVSPIFFVDEKPDIAGMFGKPIIPLDKIPRGENLDALIIITKNFDSCKAVLREFQNKGYSKFFNPVSSQLVNRQMQRRINKMWLMQVSAFCVRNSDNPNVNPEVIFQSLIHQMSERESKKAVVVISNISPRSYKIIKTLKNSGFYIECIFFKGASGNQDVRSNIIEAVDYSVETSDHFEILLRLINSQASFVYFFSHVWQLELLAIVAYLIYKKEFLPTVVFEEYDVGRFYTRFANIPLDLEKFCVENADIVCDRSFEIDYLVEELNYKLKGKLVKLFDGFNNDIELKQVAFKKDKPLNLCYAGGLVDLKTQDDWGWIELAKKCEENKCHLHVYPTPSGWNNPNSKQRFAEYFELDNNLEYFHLHEPVPYNKLINTLTQYDYGVNPMKEVTLISRAAQFGYYNQYKKIYAPTNHIFDYINANIPIVAHYPQKLIQIFKEMGVAIDFETDGFDFDFLRKNRLDYRERVKLVKEKFYMNNLITDFLKLILPERNF